MPVMPYETIIQGGCVGITLMLLVFGYRIGSQVLSLVGNHMVHITESLTCLGEKMDRLVGAVEMSNVAALRTARAATRAAKKVAVVAKAAAETAHTDVASIVEQGVDSPRHE